LINEVVVVVVTGLCILIPMKDDLMLSFQTKTSNGFIICTRGGEGQHHGDVNIQLVTIRNETKQQQNTKGRIL
jgi:hypothetical protein